MKHRILAAMICVCLALTSLCIPALADDTEAETPVPVEATPAPAEATPAPVEATPAPIVEESEEQPLEAAAVPAVQGTQSILRINDVNIDENTYYKVTSPHLPAIPKPRKRITIFTMTPAAGRWFFATRF